MDTLLGCIADDFTGATDLAGLLARSGMRVSLRIGVPDEPASNAAAFEVIALKCRTAPVDEAVAECLAAHAWLKNAGAQRFFWKYCSTFDSTDKGNIGQVAEALMDAIGCDQTIYCPAFPENGRSIYMGNLFVGRQPLAESPMKDHPLTPMRDSNLLRLLEPQVSRPVGLVDRMTVAGGSESTRRELTRLQEEGCAHVVVDAVADHDLHTIALACHSMPLLTGGSAIAMPLPKIYINAGMLEAEGNELSVPDIAPGALVLSGSCSAMTREQVARYQDIAPAFRLDPITLHVNGLNEAKQWLSSQAHQSNPIMYATAEPEQVITAQKELGVKEASDIIESALAALAVFARDLGIRRFVVAGGESSGAVTQALGINRLTIGKEIAPGVPWTFCESGDLDIALALKSGNFGAPDFFLDALNCL